MTVFFGMSASIGSPFSSSLGFRSAIRFWQVFWQSSFSIASTLVSSGEEATARVESFQLTIWSSSGIRRPMRRANLTAPTPEVSEEPRMASKASSS